MVFYTGMREWDGRALIMIYWGGHVGDCRNHSLPYEIVP